MSWYIKQVGDSSSSKGVEFQVGHYTPDGSWELLVPFIGDAQLSEEGAYRLVSFLNGGSSPFKVVTMKSGESPWEVGDLIHPLEAIQKCAERFNSMYEHLHEHGLPQDVDRLMRVLYTIADAVSDAAPVAAE
jgi:hypothetical protein